MAAEHTFFHVPPHPGPSSDGASQRMSSAKRRDTTCEVRIRKRLHALGLRYRVNHPVPGHPRRTIDVAFTSAKVAVFVDGCFWHGCPTHGVRPRSNAQWWSTKIQTNRARDAHTQSALEAAGWQVVRVWEHEDPEVAAMAVAQTVRARGRVQGRAGG